MPLIRLQLRLPLALSAHHPLQVGVRRALLAVDPAVLQLCEVALEEADLVLVGCAGDVGGAPFDAEVVVHGALVNGSLGLGNQLRAPHVAVPFCSVVDGDLCALLGVCIAWVLV